MSLKKKHVHTKQLDVVRRGFACIRLFLLYFILTFFHLESSSHHASCSRCWVLDSGRKLVLATPEQTVATGTVLGQGIDLGQTQSHPFLNS